MYCLIHIPPLIPFATINSISISVNNPNFCSFLKKNRLVMVTLVQMKNKLDEVHIF